MATGMNVQVSDWRTASELSAEVQAGQGFLFLGPRAFASPGLSWVAQLFGAETVNRPRVLSLLGSAPIVLPGMQIAPVATPTLALRSLTTDKAIYREGQDAVRLLVLDLLAPGTECVLEVDLNGREFGRHALTLDGRGAALFELRDLPTGDYRARVRGAGGDDSEFTVAVYRLAPLVASLAQRKLEGTSQLHARLRLESYGVPVEGPVHVELTDRGQRIARERCEARQGWVDAVLPLTGQGPHEIQVQLASDPSRTATVPLVGSRASERQPTLLSTLGQEIFGALLPGPSSRPVRGLYLEEGGRRSSLFQLDRVDGQRVTLRALAPIDAARIVVIDPAFPQPRPDAVDPDTATHPAHEDHAYVRAEQLFQQGKFVESRALFELGLTSRPRPHPNYAYYVACCHARQGDLAQAVASLRQAIELGWRDWQHMNGDDDLAALRGYAPYEALATGGRVELAVEALPVGGEVQVAGLGTMSLLAIGAFSEGQPWEGWSVLLAPDELRVQVIAPELPTPGSDVRVDVEVSGAPQGASVYLVVKDARLLAPDTPLNRIAGRLKGCAQKAGEILGAGPVGRPLASLLRTDSYGGPILHSPPAQPSPVMRRGFEPGAGLPMPAPGRPIAPRAMPWPGESEGARAARPVPSAAMRSGPPMPMSPPPSSGVMSPAAYGAPPRPGAPSAPSVPRAADAAPAPRAAGAPPRREEAHDEKPAAADAGATRAAVVQEPEILFAGLVETSEGRASVTVTLGPTAADYVIEAFVVAGQQGQWSERRFRADKVPSVALEVPPFVHPGDTAIGRLTVRCASGRMRVRLLRDGQPVRLLSQEREVGAQDELQATSAELSFLVEPGDHSAVVEDLGTGAADWRGERVDAPGKLRRLTRTTRLLSAGERSSRKADAGLVGLRVLPALDRPFALLVDATADYGHACCEQTAAKMVAASAMYLFGERDPGRRSRAESIVLAGVRRERSMWLRGGGFKMYPESSDEPNAFWGPKTALHLWTLATLRDASLAPSKPLQQAIEEALSMAEDATRAYGLSWPPAVVRSCEDAYQVMRFGRDAARGAQALEQVRRQAGGVTAHGAVAQRTELAYAAAALLRGGAAADRAVALALANRVLSEFGPQGRLYSTVDSVAAIALLSELRAAGIASEGGTARVNGQTMATREAVGFAAEVSEVEALQGVVAVEESRLVEEDWPMRPGSVPVRVALERQGRPGRRLSSSDDVALRITLEGGYKAGDLAWVCLPEALSRVQGGGQVKMFSVDFAGKNEVTVPLAATGLTVGRDGQAAAQHFAVCVRNMFEQERAGSPGLMDVVVEDAGAGLGRWFRSLKALFVP